MPSPRHTHVSFSAPDFRAIEAARAKYKSVDLAPRTVASYAADVRVFEAWTEAAGFPALPATEETVEKYVSDLIDHHGRKITTMERHCYAIHRHHRLAGHPSPYGAGVKQILCGARRALAQMPHQKAPIELQDLKAMLRKIGGRTPIRARNSALLVFGFATALRRGSLAALRVDDIQFTRDGFLVLVRHEKQSRNGEVRRVAVPFGDFRSTCPVKILRRWLKARGDAPGALFCNALNGVTDGKHMRGNRIAQIVQESVALVGLDRRRFGAHSMRAGLATEALENGVNEILVARQLGHASLDTLRMYERSRNLFRGNPAGLVGL